MADEKLTTIKNGAIDAPYVYYISDPTKPGLHHLPVPSFIDLSKYIKEGGLWKWHIEKPDDSLKDPIWKDGKWVENDTNAQTQLIAEQQEQIKSLISDNKVAKKDTVEKQKQIDDLQSAITNSNHMVGQLGKQFNQFGTQMTQAMSQVTEDVNKLTEVSKKDGDK